MTFALKSMKGVTKRHKKEEMRFRCDGGLPSCLHIMKE